MTRRKYVIELVAQVVKDLPTAEMVVERLQEEGLLNLGYGDKDVEAIVQAFGDTFGTTKVSKYDRFAAHRLAEKYSSQAVVGIVKLLAQSGNEKYAPVVNNVTQLEEKMPSILNFLRKTGGEEIIE